MPPKTPKTAASGAAKAALIGWITEVAARNGTDLLLAAGSPPLARMEGDLEPLRGPSLTPNVVAAIVSDILTPEAKERLDVEKDVDLAMDAPGYGRVRLNIYMQRGSWCIACRLIPLEVPNLDDLGLPAAAQAFCDLHQGLVLVTGPTGSGKSTTMAAMVDRISRQRACHILTIEDPIEYLHPHRKAAVTQREVGRDARSFSRALRAALRENPDVVMVGEMRDLETIQIALTIAATGHLVLGSLHTNDTAQTIDRVVDVFPHERQQQIRIQLAAGLAGVIYQQLLQRPDGGRVAAYEVLVATSGVRGLVREGKTAQIRNVVATGQRDGMQTLEASLSALVRSGKVTLEDALARSLYPQDIKRATTPEESPPASRRKRGGPFGISLTTFPTVPQSADWYLMTYAAPLTLDVSEFVAAVAAAVSAPTVTL
jgi:twitching motility protein PilT